MLVEGNIEEVFRDDDSIQLLSHISLNHLSYEKKTSYFRLYWWFNGDLFSGL